MTKKEIVEHLEAIAMDHRFADANSRVSALAVLYTIKANEEDEENEQRSFLAMHKAASGNAS